MSTKHFTVSVKSRSIQKTPSLLVNLLQDQCPCIITKSMISRNQSSKCLSLFSKDIEKQERRRQQNRKAAKRLKDKRQLLENDLYKTVQTLQRQYYDLQNYIEQLNERKQYLLNEIVSVDIINNTSNSDIYSLEMNLFDESFEEILNSHLYHY